MTLSLSHNKVLCLKLLHSLAKFVSCKLFVHNKHWRQYILLRPLTKQHYFVCLTSKILVISLGSGTLTTRNLLIRDNFSMTDLQTVANNHYQMQSMTIFILKSRMSPVDIPNPLIGDEFIRIIIVVNFEFVILFSTKH